MIKCGEIVDPSIDNDPAIPCIAVFLNLSKREHTTRVCFIGCGSHSIWALSDGKTDWSYKLRECRD